MVIDILRESELLAKARAGDAKAIQVLYEKYLKNSVPIMKLLKVALSQAEDREDALHDILLTVLNNKTEFRGESQLSTYVFQIARLTLLQRFRREATIKRGSLVRVISDSDAVTNKPSQQTPYYHYEEKETREIIQHLVEGLPEAYREAVRLRLLEELSYQEIAAALRIPSNTVATRIHKGKKLLIEMLKRRGYWEVFSRKGN